MASRHVTPLRYYLYVSDNKLEMLFEQIDQGARKRISAELKIDLKIASLTLSQSDDPAPTRSAKLRIVERFIDLHHNVGNDQEPGQEYFRSKMSMRWGRAPGSSVLFMGSGSESSTRVILLGSFNNVLGVDLPRLEGYSRSQLFHIIRTLRELEHRRDSNLPHSRTDPEGVRLRIDPEGVWLQRVWYSLSRLDNIAHSAEKDSIAALPPQQLEYLGIPLLESSREVGEPHIVLGTPLYVAMAR